MCTAGNKIYIRNQSVDADDILEVLDLDENDPQWKRAATFNRDHLGGKVVVVDDRIVKLQVRS